MSDLGQMIKEKREAKHLTIKELSKLTNLSESVINDLENNRFDYYKGEEIYVKGYIKRLGRVLDIDVEGMTQTYDSLTQEIKQKELEEAIEKKELEKEQINNRNKVHLQDLKLRKPEYTKTQAVYSDDVTSKYIQSGIIVVIIIAIIAVCFYGISKTKDKVQTPPSFNANTTTNVKGNVDEDESATNKDSEDTNTTQEIKVVRNGFLDFTITLPENLKELTFKAEFGSNTWSQFFVDEVADKTIQAKVYAKGEYIEAKFDPTTVKTFRLHNGFNLDHKYYVNGVELPLDAEADNSTNVGDLVIRIANNADSNTVTTNNSQHTTTVSKPKKKTQTQTNNTTTNENTNTNTNASTPVEQAPAQQDELQQSINQGGVQ